MNVREQRAQSQRIYLLETYSDEKYLVAGLTNNYNVSLDPQSCTCMDFIRRRQTCKHLYFVKHRVQASTAQSITRNDTECTICFEELHEPLYNWKCAMCSHELHLECFQTWRAYNREATCPYCRHP